MTRSLVTGAAGFIGRRLVAELLAGGQEVVAVDHFSRNDPAKINWRDGNRVQSASAQNTDGVTVFAADIRDPKQIGQAMKTVDRVFHAAATVSTKSLALSESVNVEGTRVIGEAAAAQPTPPVFVYLSSLAAAGPSRDPVIESDPCQPVSHYGRTKLKAESELHGLAKDLPITIIRPPCIIGPGDRNLLALYQTVQWGWNLVLSKKSRYSYLSVTDLVPGLITASHRGRRLCGLDDNGRIDVNRIGTYYMTDPKPVTFVELADMIAATIQKSRVHHLRIPTSIGWAVGAYGEFLLRVFGKKVYLNLDKIREGVGGSWVCDGSRAAEDLSFAPGADLATRIEETTIEYRNAGWIP